jgi:hypothetical protein
MCNGKQKKQKRGEYLLQTVATFTAAANCRLACTAMSALTEFVPSYNKLILSTY